MAENYPLGEAMAMAPNLNKAELRRCWRQRRRQALAAAADELLAVARRELPARVPGGRRLGLYRPLGSEPDLLPLAPLLADRLALPAVRPGTPPRAGAPPGDLQLTYLPWSPGEALIPDACGIPSPTGGQPLEAGAMALLLVPALAIDRRGLRLGSGGGWFDRLRADPAWRAVPALAVLPAACVVESLPQDPWDVPFDGWLDEHGLHAIANVASS